MTTTVLVTGGAGYVGSHAAKALHRAGYLPVTVDDLSRGVRAAVRWGPLEQGSILDRAFLDRVIGHWRPSAVLHFAAFAYVGESMTDPGLYYRNNVAGSLSLLEACRDFQIARIVFSSSCATYGVPLSLPITEQFPQTPINPYGASKWMVERILRDFQTHGIDAVILRYFNAAGADPDGEIGENHTPETHLIPLAIAAALQTGPALTIFGDDYDTADGTCVRDYVHVSDLAEAHVLALRHLETGAGGMACNLGTGSGHSVRAIVAAVARAARAPVPVTILPRRAGDPPALVADARYAHATLGWRPVHSDLEQIVQTALAWAQRNRTHP